MDVGSLFSGVGGFELGFRNAGFDISWSNEINSDACMTFRNNFDTELFEGDIYDLRGLRKVDVICAGFPCQAFSIAGKRKGLKDKRGVVVGELIRIIDEVKPKMFLLENVQGLMNHHLGVTMLSVLKALKKIGYIVKYKLMNTCDYSDLPQNRERVYLVGFLCYEESERFDFPAKFNGRKKIKDLLDDDVDDKYFCENEKYYEKVKDLVKREDTLYQWRRVGGYLRENKSGMCPALTVFDYVPLFLDRGRIRRLSPRECFRFQGFPDNYILEGLSDKIYYEQAGNSVSVPVIRRIAERMREVFV